MSDPRGWSDDDWQEFYEEHTDGTPEDAASAADAIQDSINAAEDGNYNNTVDGIGQLPSGPMPSA